MATMTRRVRFSIQSNQAKATFHHATNKISLDNARSGYNRGTVYGLHPASFESRRT